MTSVAIVDSQLPHFTYFRNYPAGLLWTHEWNDFKQAIWLDVGSYGFGERYCGVL